ncbi:MAG TPA: hypothetical protein V6C97_16180 [Oculatellaceae cyanobacterium]
MITQRLRWWPALVDARLSSRVLVASVLLPSTGFGDGESSMSARNGGLSQLKADSSLRLLQATYWGE